MTPLADNRKVLNHILTNTKSLLLDFDGPVCSVFARLPASIVADQLRLVLARGGHENLPDEVRNSGDPFDVFFYAKSLGEAEAYYVESAFAAHEVEAIQTATPTPGAHDLIAAWYTTGKSIAIVSNNSKVAVETYLQIHDLAGLINHIAARTGPVDPRLKPAPDMVTSAVRALNGAAETSTLIGDSASDVVAACRAGVTPIGFANKPGKSRSLTGAGATVIVKDYSWIREFI